MSVPSGQWSEQRSGLGFVPSGQWSGETLAVCVQSGRLWPKFGLTKVAKVCSIWSITIFSMIDFELHCPRPMSVWRISVLCRGPHLGHWWSHREQSFPTQSTIVTGKPVQFQSWKPVSQFLLYSIVATWALYFSSNLIFFFCLWKWFLSRKKVDSLYKIAFKVSFETFFI